MGFFISNLKLQTFVLDVMKLTITFLAFFLLFACQKDRIKLTDHTEFVGDYQWYHSYSPNSNDYESYQSTQDQFGIRIKENGKVEFYTNGSLFEKGYVTSVLDSSILIKLKLSETTEAMVLSDTELTLSNYPFDGFTNQFKKHE